MATENIRSELDEEDCCNICYDNECETSSLIILKCCNDSKKICVKCVNCLKTPICPYCRKTLDSTCTPFMNKNAILSSSQPTRSNSSFLSWENFLSQENIIDPSLYNDSRRMRRMMRRLRHQYRQINTPNASVTRNITHEQRRRYHRLQRENNRNIAREAMNVHNQSNYLDELFFMD